MILRFICYTGSLYLIEDCNIASCSATGHCNKADVCQGGLAGHHRRSGKHLIISATTYEHYLTGFDRIGMAKWVARCPTLDVLRVYLTGCAIARNLPDGVISTFSRMCVILAPGESSLSLIDIS